MEIPAVYLAYCQKSIIELFYQKPPPSMLERVLGTFMNNITNNNALVGVQVCMYYVTKLSNACSKSTTKFMP